MKTEKEIRARMKELRKDLKRRKAHFSKEETKDHLLALIWVLNGDSK